MTCRRSVLRSARVFCAVILFSMALDAQTIDSRKDPGGGNVNMTTATKWTLATDDTTVKLSVESNKIFIASLRNSGQNWEWVPTPCEVPLPGKESVRVGTVGQTPDWTYRDATEVSSNGYMVVLRFTSTKPALELKSFWGAQPGPGPVENWVSIENKSNGNVTYTPGIVAAGMRVRADKQVNLHRADKTAVGTGKVHFDPIGANARLGTGTGQIPFIILDAATEHGLYLGFEWELGGFQVVAGADPLDIGVSAHPVTEDISRGPNEIFDVPSVYYGVYKGDIDDGANAFKRWFWNHKITRSLHDNPDEPWVEVCMQELGGNGSASVTGGTPQSAYDRLAATGAECAKMDFWDGSGKCWYTGRDWTFKPAVWPNGFDFAAKTRKAGMKASLYMGGTYNDADLTTIVGRDSELTALLERFDKGWFDMWRTDLYTAPREPMPQTYEGVKNFLYIHDQLIAKRPGYRYENCCNGGKYKGFAICRRMTFCTINDVDQNPVATRTTYYANTFAINPVQLKSDLGPAQTAYQLRTDMLGSILTWAADNSVYRQHIALYKSRQRPILRGANVYHILPMPDGKNWDGLQFHNPDLDRGSVFLFKPSAEAPTSQVVRLRGLIRDKTYDVAFQDATERSCSMTGAKLVDDGLTVTLTGNAASEIIWLNCFELSANPAELAFTVADQGAKALDQKVAITYRRGPDPDKAFTITVADPWLRVAPLSGAGHGQTVAVSVDPGDLPSAIHRSKITVSRQDLQDRIEVPVRLRIGTPVPRTVTLTPSSGMCVVNGKQRFSAVVDDQFGEPFPCRIQWAVSGGGKVDDQGVFHSAGTAGVFTVTGAVVGYPTATATTRMHVASTDFARWKLDEKDGTVAADAWGEFKGTLVGGPTWVPGKLGGALHFSGNGQYVDTKWSLEGLQFPCTFAFWVKPGDTQVAHADIFGNHEGATKGVVMQQNGEAINEYSFGYGSSPATGGAGPVQLTADEWQHVAVVCDGSEVIAYRNGEEVARGAGKNPLTPNPNLGFRLGSGYGAGRFFNGVLDDFRIYARALGGAEVAALARETDEVKDGKRNK